MLDTAVEATFSSRPLPSNEHVLDGQLKLIYSIFVRAQDVALKTCRKRWTIETTGERESIREIRARDTT